MSQLEQKLLGIKSQNYCDDSSDDDEGFEPLFEPTVEQQPPFVRRFGSAVNTGPKGVIEDERQYQTMLLEELRKNQEDTIRLLKRTSLTCEPFDEEKSGGGGAANEDDEIFKKYCQRRLDEMYKRYANLPTFGMVTNLSADNFAASIDREQPDVIVLVHLFSADSNLEACQCMDACFDILAKRYIKVKFCRFDVSSGGSGLVSKRLSRKGCPAIIAYKNGVVVGNLVCLANTLGNDFFVDALENLLFDHDILPESYRR